MKITSDWLKKHHACESGIRVFRQEWPDGAEVNEVNLHRAISLRLSLVWLLGHIGTKRALAELDRVETQVLAEYTSAKRQRQASWAEFSDILGQAVIVAILESAKE